MLKSERMLPHIRYGATDPQGSFSSATFGGPGGATSARYDALPILGPVSHVSPASREAPLRDLPSSTTRRAAVVAVTTRWRCPGASRLGYPAGTVQVQGEGALNPTRVFLDCPRTALCSPLRRCESSCVIAMVRRRFPEPGDEGGEVSRDMPEAGRAARDREVPSAELSGVSRTECRQGRSVPWTTTPSMMNESPCCASILERGRAVRKSAAQRSRPSASELLREHLGAPGAAAVQEMRPKRRGDRAHAKRTVRSGGEQRPRQVRLNWCTSNDPPPARSARRRNSSWEGPRKREPTRGLHESSFSNRRMVEVIAE